MPSDALPLRFRRIFAARLFFLTVALAANLLLLLNVLELESALIVFAAGTTSYAVVTASLWRCPSCGRYPGNSVMPDLCERCGVKLFGHDRRIPETPNAAPTDPHKTVHHLLVVRTLYGVALIAIFAVWGTRMEHYPALFWTVTLAFMALGAWGEWKWWRCPHCGSYLRRTFWPGRSCGKCGGKLL